MTPRRAVTLLLLLLAGYGPAACREDPESRSPAAASAPAAGAARATSTTSTSPAPTESEPAPLEPGTTRVRIGDETFTLEIADSRWEKERGLMFRRSMPADRGMIFVFEDADDRSFWMRNTSIPLDILYLAPDGRIISIKHMAPFDERGVRSDGPAKYAIELNLGAAERVGVKRGDQVTIPPDILALKPRD